MKSGRILFTLQQQTETILFAVLFLAVFLLAAVLSGLGYGGLEPCCSRCFQVLCPPCSSSSTISAGAS